MKNKLLSPTLPPSTLGANTGCGAAWSAHLLWEQGVAGSNPASPTQWLDTRVVPFAGELFQMSHHVAKMAIGHTTLWVTEAHWSNPLEPAFRGFQSRTATCAPSSPSSATVLAK